MGGFHRNTVNGRTQYIEQRSAAADLEKARLLYDAQLYEDAKQELVMTATSDAPAEDKAAALYLLGTIAVDEKRYDAAVRTWSDLIAKYPDSEDAGAREDSARSDYGAAG